MKIVMRFFIVFVLWCVPFTLSYSQRRAKRIAYGLPLQTHDAYNTNYIVELMLTHACLSDQTNHKLTDCIAIPSCGGALVQPDFILTACHCMVYETWIRKNVSIPPVVEFGPDDVPYWLDDRVNTKVLDVWDLEIAKKEVLHPTLNHMTIWAGATVLDDSPQRRHAAAFFPHHLCAERQERKFPEKWKNRYYEMDIGLVRTCQRFDMNRNLRLAPMLPYSSVEESIGKYVEQSHVCMWAGWGVVDSERDTASAETQHKIAWAFPDILQHTFRYLACHLDCFTDSNAVCSLCSHHIGYHISHPTEGDSGSPIHCNGYVVGVHAVQGWQYALNYTAAWDVNVACVKDLLSNANFQYLRSTTPKIYHYLDGRPVTPQTPDDNTSTDPEIFP